MIRAYPDYPSVLPGQILSLRVSTNAPKFRVEFYRVGTSLFPIGDLGSGWLSGADCPLHSPGEDWSSDSFDGNGQLLPGWPRHNFLIPVAWSSGVYIAVCTEGDANSNPISVPDLGTADGSDSKALFVVRSASPGLQASILYKVPLFTYQAYNELGDPMQSLYTGAAVASLRRPGGGTGGRPWDSYATANRPVHPDVYDLWNPGPPQTGSPRQSFAHWDAKFIAWMERRGYVVEYCTDLDLHEDSGSFLRSYGLLVSAGHDEYWSQEMRDNVAAFVRNGGNVAFFSGNTCWKRIAFLDPAHISFHIAGLWWQLNDPEDALTGVSYRNAGGQWDGPRPRGLGYQVQNDDSWFYRFTNLQNGNILGDYYFGDANDPAALVGYECDGALVDRNLLGKVPTISPTGEGGTPQNFVILGWSDVSGWEDYTFPSGAPGNRVATMGFYIDSGTVFNAATTDWARVLDSGKAPEVERITRNVLNGLSRLYRVASPAHIAGFFSSDDNVNHAIVVSAAGDVKELFYDVESGQGLAALTTSEDTVAVGAFFSSDDNVRHVLIGTAAGDLTEVFFNPQQGQGQVVLTNLPDIVGVAGFFSDDDNYRHGIVGTADGNVTEVFYHPQQAQGQVVLANLPGIIAIGGFYSSDDNYRHAIIGTVDGNITEVFYNPQQGQGQVVLTNLPGIISLAGFFSSDDGFRHVVVATKTGDITELFYHPSFGQGQVVLANLPGVIGLGAFYSEDDGFRRVVVAILDGSIREIFYHPNQGIFLR